jgi:uncharacterized protein YgiM (DUF1202 family)
MWRKLAVVTLTLVALASLGTQPVQAQQGVVWNTEFFNNIYLLGTPTLTRQDDTIAFDWVYGSPALNVNADNFSARWASDPYFPAGTYRFYTLADDSVCLWVGFQRLLDTFNYPRVGEILSADVTLSEGVHHIQVDYRENGGNAYLFVTWANLATNPTGPNFPVPVQVPPAVNISNNYWTAQYYSNADLVGTPSLVQAEPWTLVRHWGTGSPWSNIPADNFSARWTGIRTLSAGTYRISAYADDGVRVFVDGRPVINEFHSATDVTYTADVAVIAGQHNVMVEYYEAGGLAFVEVTLTPVSVVAPSQAITTTGGTLRVTANLLNVRQSPSCDCGVLTRVRYGETYPIVGRNADNSWWQINVNGTVGWVFSRFTEVFNTAYVPVTDQSSAVQFPATGYNVTATATGVLRSHPGNRNAYLGYIPAGRTAQVVGRNADSTWWQVNYNGVIGWVRAALTYIEPAPDIGQIPVRS